MIHELRIYDVVPGRMADLHARFATLTLPLFHKHGIEVVGFWEDIVGSTNRLTYIVAYEDMAHRDRAWTAFISDPAWIEGAARTEEHGPLVARVTNTLMRPTPYSPLH
jgi:NIPSNAP